MNKKSFMMLKPTPDKCQECGVDHKPDQPHNKESIFYQIKFYIENDRYPTWADAIAHCKPELQAKWKDVLKERDVWTE